MSWHLFAALISLYKSYMSPSIVSLPKTLTRSLASLNTITNLAIMQQI